MSYEIDPEVAADIALRERTAAERAGLSDADFGRAIAETAAPAKVVERVPCRARCGNVTDWTEEAEDRFAMFNRELARRAEAPLDKTRIVFCSACRAKGVSIAAENNRKFADAMRDLVKKLKASGNPERETELIAKLRKWHHPDVDGLLEALRVKRTLPGGKRTKASEVSR